MDTPLYLISVQERDETILTLKRHVFDLQEVDDDDDDDDDVVDDDDDDDDDDDSDDDDDDDDDDDVT